ncbi:hypothetical protein RI367_000850 [Sorochytrium milnesiophthora]
MALKNVFWFWLLGGALGAFFDGLHVHYEVLAYKPSEFLFFKQAWWVFPLFATGGLLGGLSPYLMPGAIFYRMTRSRSLAIAFLQTFTCLTIYFLSSYLSYHHRLYPVGRKLDDDTISMILGAIFIVVWGVTTAASMRALLVCGLVGFSGFVFEYRLCEFGIFRYLHPDEHGLYMVNHWIVWIWGSAALAMAHLAAIFVVSDETWATKFVAKHGDGVDAVTAAKAKSTAGDSIGPAPSTTSSGKKSKKSGNKKKKE